MIQHWSVYSVLINFRKECSIIRGITIKTRKPHSNEAFSKLFLESINIMELRH